MKEPVRPIVMIVDDTPANLKLLEQLLAAEKFRISAFPSGAMALAAVERVRPDIILLDIMMPVMDGFETCRKLKESTIARDIPVIFLSALDDARNKVEAFSSGGVDYIVKPFQQAEVIARVRTHLNLRRMRQEVEQYNKRLQSMVEEQVREISDSQIATIIALSKLAESRDDDTGNHVERTVTFCRLLAHKLRMHPACSETLDDEYIDDLIHAATLHDIGKVAIPDRILLKPGPLTSEEFAVMKTHTLRGAETLELVRARYPRNKFLTMGILIARSHHERWNGSGYPDGLKGEEIPLCARIMAMADVYDALRSRRPYKEPMTEAATRSILVSERGKHFDPNVIDAFLAVEGEFEAVYRG